jgi:glycosyltransferase involved in cell wall biosynthesis
VQRDKITVVPNALQEAMFETCDESDIRAVVGRHGLEGRRVIGYFGSFFDWEGVDALVKALPSVLRMHPKAILLLAGSGRTERNVRSIVEDLGLADSVVFAGRIDAAEMAAYYGVADVVAYPRVANRLTEMVTPLKPLEAMAQGTPVIASDIGGHRELIEDGVTGFLYDPKEPAGLASSLNRVLADFPQAIVDSARSYVRRDRRWSVVVENYRSVYERFGIGHD